jgi:hypothetical protein
MFAPEQSSPAAAGESQLSVNTIDLHLEQGEGYAMVVCTVMTPGPGSVLRERLDG